ncbi:DUF1905 domain-containing protein [Candidatus Deianiraea vastatrix]|uniref:DUF1905 domain-containing protein n=1 Tax=Candidatus Deianiraea vastatrix TaxID=2163644 RepID=A0A5B8XHL5_9RICK|nr:DUF1905 domain-containing protein [Candidatus Deianiraea vastatrix]QED23614.1 hypothetical protein Deia_00827 [Candidatus Deianiraea vastatrix]
MFLSFNTTVIKYSTEKASWYFAPLPLDVAKNIKSLNKSKLGFGSVKVIAIINETQWQTSIFPDSKSSSYILPIKSEIRQKNNITENTTVNIAIEVFI